MTRFELNSSPTDTILRQMPPSAFEAMISEALKLIRDGDLLATSTLTLAHASIIADSFFAGEAISSDARGRAMHSLMRWAVERLRPVGEHSWLATPWRGYNILNYFYLEGMKASDLAEAMAISEQTLYQSRPQAMANLAQILREEIEAPTDKRRRQHYALANRYARHSETEQHLLRASAVFTRSIPVALFHQLIPQRSVADLQTSIHQLVGSNLLLASDAGTEVALHPEMRDFLLTLLAPDERTHFHEAASQHYLQQHDYLEAARQRRRANDMAGAAEILIEHKKKMFDNLQIEDLGDLVSQFQRAELSLDLWTRLKIVSGEIAEFSKETEVALHEYQQALAAPDLPTKALAYYRRAKAFERQNVGESLAHYGYAVRLIEDLRAKVPSHESQPSKGFGEQTNLLVQMYIDRAWLYIQAQPDLHKAEADLTRARGLIEHNSQADQSNRAIWSDLHNALGQFYVTRHNLEDAAQNHWQAWLAANEIQDIARMTNTAHNLGDTFSELGDFVQALHYLGQSLDLSNRSNNRQMEGLCTMNIGACYFWQKRFVEAIDAYHAARHIFEETGNHTLQIRTYFNLAEVYAEISDMVQMRHYFDIGALQAQKMNDQAALDDFLGLAERYPGLQTNQNRQPLSARQMAVLDHLKEHGQITNRDVQALTALSQKQTVRDLNELVEMGLIARHGQGRATHYRLQTGSPT